MNDFVPVKPARCSRSCARFRPRHARHHPAKRANPKGTARMRLTTVLVMLLTATLAARDA
jgi:hypothetical protein